MKRLSATTLILLLTWVQVMVAISQPVAASSGFSHCCDCNSPCCIEQSSTDSAPQPLAAVPSVTQVFQPFSIATLIAWTLPRGEVATFSPAVSSPLVTEGMPLFQRNCTLLI